VKVEICTDLSLLRSSHMVPFKSHNKIILGTSLPHCVFQVPVELAVLQILSVYVYEKLVI